MPLWYPGKEDPVGILAPMFGGGGQTQTQQSKTEPWEPQQPYLKTGFAEAQRIYDSGQPGVYTGTRVAPLGADTTAALDMIRSTATGNTALLPAAQGAYSDTIAGKFLDPSANPAWGSTVDAIVRGVRPAVDSQFEGSGRYGSALHAGTVASAIADKVAPLAANMYAQERQNQLAAAGNAPALDAARYADANQLAGVGSVNDQYNQAVTNADIAQYNEQQNADWNRLANFMQMVQGQYGSSNTTTATTSYKSDPFTQIAGFALGGLNTAAKAKSAGLFK